MALYLAADIESVQTCTNCGPEKRLEEHLKTGRDFVLFAINDLLDQRPELDMYIDKTNNVMDVYHGDKFLRSIPVTTGQKLAPQKSKFGEYVTPDGDYLVIDYKEKEELEQKFGTYDADRFYAGRMIQLSGPWAPHIAIHATHEEEEIGEHASNGCIRVTIEDFDWLKEIGGIGSRVHVSMVQETPLSN
jgi:lipoprotein-anchoring transpeptidase ErfK/SrfK